MKPEKKAVELTDDEKVVFKLLKAESPVELPALKEKAGLSNKKWDKPMKGLTGKKVAKVENTEKTKFQNDKERFRLNVHSPGTLHPPCRN